MKPEHLTLLDLNRLVKDTLERKFTNRYWIVAEIGEANEHPSGHCYLELIQKDETDEKISAKARATIWSYTYRMLKPFFESSTGQSLKRGLKIMINVRVVFHELYGFSLNVLDIDPGYTVGDLELQRRQTISKLIADGIIEMNKELEIPMLPNRIAIISSSNAAGYQDFIRQLTRNPYGYSFTTKLFDSAMQGEGAEDSIIRALDRIHSEIEHFDCVAIVRGGGAQTDLTCFDSYNLAFNIAQFPLPVISGIGHDKDQTITDMVAHTSVKTPTAAAEFFISRLVETELHLQTLAGQLGSLTQATLTNRQSHVLQLSQQLVQCTNKAIITEKFKLQNLVMGIPGRAQHLLTRHRNTTANYQIQIARASGILKNESLKLSVLADKIGSSTGKRLNSQQVKLGYLADIIRNLHPDNILKRGFSITLHNGKVLKSINKLDPDSEIVTQLYNGVIKSRITDKKRKGILKK